MKKSNQCICKTNDSFYLIRRAQPPPPWLAQVLDPSEKQAVAKPQRLQSAHNERPPPEPRKGPAWPGYLFTDGHYPLRSKQVAHQKPITRLAQRIGQCTQALLPTAGRARQGQHTPARPLTTSPPISSFPNSYTAHRPGRQALHNKP